MVVKNFFVKRNEREIKDLETKIVENPRGIVSEIEDLDSKRQGLILDFTLVHPDFEDKEKDENYISRRTMRGAKIRYGKREYLSYLKLNQPRSRTDALKDTRLPLHVRNEAFRKMGSMAEEEIFYVGFMRFPITGRDRSPVLVPFWSVMEGLGIDIYNGRICSKLPVEFQAGSFVEREYGPNIFVRVPSRTKNRKKYLQRWSNVPVFDVQEKKIQSWNTKVRYGSFDLSGNFKDSSDDEPEHKIWNVGYHSNKAGESFSEDLIYPHCCAGYQEIIRNFMRQGNFIPLERSQNPVPSRSDALFWNKLNNNVLMRDRGRDGKVYLRPLRIDQKSILMARRVAKYSLEYEGFGKLPETMYWDAERDGRIKDYPYLPGEE